MEVEAAVLSGDKDEEVEVLDASIHDLSSIATAKAGEQ